MVLIGQEAFHPFLAKERLRPDRGLPKKAGARELGRKEGLELKVWSGGSARRAASATQAPAFPSAGSGPQ